MEPLQRAMPGKVSKKRRAAIIRHIRDEAAAMGQKIGWGKASQLYEDNVGKGAEVWMNDTYTVYVNRDAGGTVAMGNGETKPLPWIHLSIKRNDRQPVTDWRDKQAIKNQLVGPECEAVELFPAQTRLVDCANEFHLWCCPDPTWRFPLGFTKGLTGTAADAARWGAVQRD